MRRHIPVIEPQEVTPENDPQTRLAWHDTCIVVGADRP
jgi:hypothetical protein